MQDHCGLDDGGDENEVVGWLLEEMILSDGVGMIQRRWRVGSLVGDGEGHPILGLLGGRGEGEIIKLELYGVPTLFAKFVVQRFFEIEVIDQ